VSEKPGEALLGALRLAKSGFELALGIVVDEATGQRVTAHLVVSPEHRQLHGVVHGGVYSSLVETVASVGASLAAPAGHVVMGLENTTSFLRATKEGILRATGLPLACGRRTQVWEVRIEDEEGRLVATGRLRLLSVEAASL
jgi:1,4-dihydroxy-2-naphthoyl-CoA hydrolase